VDQLQAARQVVQYANYPPRITHFIAAKTARKWSAIEHVLADMNPK
jgi:2-keto-3-deoxy-L-rhamnonate aldolase RhmA